MDEDLEARGVTGQLEKSQDADDGEELQDVCVLHVFEKMLEQHVRIEAKGGHEVDPVEGRLEEGGDGGCHDEPDDDLESEPDVTDQLHVEERVMGKGLRFVQGPVGGVLVPGPHCYIPDNGDSKARVSLQAERQD